MPLTDTAICNAKPSQKLVKLSDGGGLYLLIQPHGTKLWRLAYRFGGKQKLLAFGIYPTVSLAEARARRDAAKQFLGEGIDPSVRRKLEKRASVVTFRLVAEELLDKMQREGRAPRTLIKTRWLLGFAYPTIGDRPIAKVGALSSSMCCERSKRAGTMKRPGGCAAPAAWCFAMPLPRDELNAIRQ